MIWGVPATISTTAMLELTRIAQCSPRAQITSPTSGSIVVRSQKIYTATSDNVGVVRVELYADNALAASSTSSSPMFNLNTNQWTKGLHTLQILAYDAAGDAGASAIV